MQSIILTGAFLTALVASLIATLWVRDWAIKAELVDRPDDHRKMHDRPIPRVGGIAVFFAVVLTIVIGYLIGIRGEGEGPLRSDLPVLPLMAAGTAVFMIGLWDDLRGLSARSKILLEFVVAATLFMIGIQIRTLFLPWGTALDFPHVLSLGVTTLWLVGITNAFNLIDGSDGIAAGAALFAACAMAVVSLLSGNIFGALVGLAIAGATLGFLYFNFPPASIFLGDSGSLFIGFMLGTLGVITTQKTTTTLAVLIPVVSCGLPILDTLLAIARRFLRRDGIFMPDRGHIHHRLRDLGHSPRRIALLLYAVSAAFAMLSLLLIQTNASVLTILFVVAGGVLWAFVQRLHIPELLEVRRMMSRGWQQRSIIRANVKIRDAVAQMSRASRPADILQALRVVFATREFAVAEMWLPKDMGDRFIGLPGVAYAPDGGVAWHARQADYPEDGDFCELRLSLRDASGVKVGRVSLWLANDRQHFASDLTVLTREFNGELNSAVLRISELPRPVVVRDTPLEPIVERVSRDVERGAREIVPLT